MPRIGMAGWGGAEWKLGRMQGFSSKDLRNVAGVQLAVGASVAVALSVAFSDTNSAFARSIVLSSPLFMCSSPCKAIHLPMYRIMVVLCYTFVN